MVKVDAKDRYMITTSLFTKDVLEHAEELNIGLIIWSTPFQYVITLVKNFLLQLT